MPRLGRTVPCVVAFLLSAGATRAEIVVAPGFAQASSTAFSDLNGNGVADPNEVVSSPPLTDSAESFDETSSIGTGPARGSATIHSSVSASGGLLVATASGTCHAEAPLPPGELENQEAVPHQAFGNGGTRIVFNTTERARFSILASVSAIPGPSPREGGGSTRATVMGLRGSDRVDIQATDAFLDIGSDSASASGVLEPGEHDVQLNCGAEAPRRFGPDTDAPFAEARYSLLLTVTEADCEGTLHRWVGGPSGAFGDPASWDPPEVPTFSGDADCDTALFQNEGDVTLDLGGALSRGPRGVGVERRTGRKQITNTQTLRTVGGTLILDSLEPGIGERSLEIGNARLLIDAGGIRARHVIVGEGGDGELEVVGPGGFFTTQGRFGIGGDGNGLAKISNGAVVTSAETVIGEGEGGGSAAVEGADTLWQTGNLAVGFADDAGLTIGAGARVESESAFVDCQPAGGSSALGCPGLAGDERAEVAVSGSASGTPSAWALAGTLGIGARGKVSVAGGAALEAFVVEVGTSGNDADCIAGRACLEVVDGRVTADGVKVGTGGHGKLRIGASGRVTGSFGVSAGSGQLSDGEIRVLGPSTEPQLTTTETGLTLGNAFDARGVLALEGGARAALGGTSLVGASADASGLIEVREGSVLQIAGASALLELGRDTPGDDVEATGELLFSSGRLELPGTDLVVRRSGRVTGTGRIEASGAGGVTNGGFIGCGVVVNAIYLQGPTGVVECPAATLGAGAAPQLNPLAASSFARALARRPKPVPPPFPGPFVVEGDATLDGTLVLQFLNGFAPRTGDAFELLDVSGNVTGGFANVVVRGLAPGFDFAEDGGAGGLTLTSLNDAEPLPAVSLKAKPTLKEKKKRGLKVKVSRAGDTSQALSVRYAIRGTARNGIDYNLLPGVVEIPAQKKSAKLLLRPVAEGLEEGPETIELELLPGENYAPSLAASVAIEIEDGDGEVKKPGRP